MFGLFQRDIVPTIIVYVTESIPLPTSGSSTAKSTSTVVLTEVVGKQGTVTLPSNAKFTTITRYKSPKSKSQGTKLMNLSEISSLLAASQSSRISQTSSTNISGASSAPSNNVFASGSQSNTNVALAVAIPILTICMVGLAVFGVFLRQKRQASPKRMRGPDLQAEDFQLDRSDSQKKPTSSVYSPEEKGIAGTTEDFANEFEPPTKQEKNGFLKRLSRIIMPDSCMDFKSPLFLRRFNLSAPERKEEINRDYTNKQLPSVPPIIYTYDPAAKNEDLGSEDDIYTVVKPYVKRLNDELTICVGDKLKISKIHSDGWATVKMVDAENSGVVPLMCVRKSS